MAIWGDLKRRLAPSGRFNHLSREFMLFYVYAARTYYPSRKNFLALYGQYGVGAIRMLEVPSLYEYYATFSTYWHVYNFLRAVAPELFLPLIGLVNATDLPNDCFLMSRTAGLPHSTDRVLSGLLSFFHLGWRGSQRFFMRPYNISNVFQMFEGEKVIERFLVQYVKPCRRCLPAVVCTNPEHDIQLDLPTDDELDSEQRYFTEILCFKTVRKTSGEGESTTEYYLRPNRTKSARFFLRNNLGLMTAVNGAFCAFALLSAVLFVVWMLVLDPEFIKRYPGCSTGWESSRAVGKSTIAWGAHRSISTLFDLIANIILSMDTALAVSFAVSPSQLIIYDLIMYWTSLSTRIEDCLRLARQYNDYYGPTETGWLVAGAEEVGNFFFGYRNVSTSEIDRLVQQDLRLRELEGGETQDDGCTQRALGRRRLRLSEVAAASGTPLIPHQARLMRDLERDVASLQSALCDFFLQVERADLFLSDIITAALFIWLGSFGTLCVFSMFGGYVPPTIRTFQLAAFILVTGMSRLLVGLHLMCVGKVYTSLCSLMALDQTKLKRRYPKILAFYLAPRNRTTFTLIQRVPFVPTTYLAILGWSVSCYFISLSLVGHNRALL